MDQLTIRAANHNDLETLREFEQGVIQAERPFDPTLKPDPIRYYDLDEMIVSDSIELLVAETEGKLVGSGYARLEQARIFLNYSHYAYLGFMFVRPDYRGKGINQQIINALKNWALARNVTELRLEVYSGNMPAIEAYKKIGFTDLLIEMRLGL